MSPHGAAELLRERESMPVVLCERIGARWRFWCPFCRRHHTHSPAPGYRSAHCVQGIDYIDGKLRFTTPSSPFTATGYILKLAPKCGARA